MKVDVENLSSVEVKVSVEVPPEDVERELDKQYREVARTVQIRGFRKGKAPRSMLEKRFGKEISADAARVLVTDRLEEVLKDFDDRAVGEPILENDPVERGQAFQFHLRLEMRPVFDAQGYKSLTLPPVDAEVTDAEVDERIDSLRESHAALVPAEEGAKADTGNVLAVDFVGTMDGEAFPGGTAEDATIELGSGRMIPGFEDELMGATEGETRSFDITFPDDYPAERLAGKATHFEVTVKAIQRKELPELDDEFAVDQGADDLAALRARVREQMEREKQSQATEARDTALVDQLLEQNPFDVPPRLLDSRTEQRMHELAHRLEHAGHDHDRAHQIVEAQADAFRKAAERELREHFILRRIAETENIEVSEADVDAYLQELADATKMPIQRLRARFNEGDSRVALENELRERKVREAVIAWSSGDGAASETAEAVEPVEAQAPTEPADTEPADAKPVDAEPVDSDTADADTADADEE